MKRPLAMAGPLLLMLVRLWAGATTLAAEGFEKGDRVELTDDAPLYFKDEVTAIGKTGDQYEVILQRPELHKVFLVTQDAEGHSIAVSVADSHLKKVMSHGVPMPTPRVLREAKPEEAVLLATAGDRSGSAFFAQMEGRIYVVTSARVVAPALAVEFKNAAGAFTINSGDVEVADDRDLVRFPVETDLGLVMSDPAKAEDAVTAYGVGGSNGDRNGRGAAAAVVVTKLPGRVMGGGAETAEEIEISCPFPPGGRGGPVVNSDGQVIGVASLPTGPADIGQWMKTGTRFDKLRHWALRVDDGTTWTRVPFAQLREESAQIEAVTQLSDYFVEIMRQLLVRTFHQPIPKRFPTNVAISNVVEKYNAACHYLRSAAGGGGDFGKARDKLKGNVSKVGDDLSEVMKDTADDLATQAKLIKTPWMQKRNAAVIRELRDEAAYLQHHLREAANTTFLN